jgi:hypothetical protein
MKRTIGLQGDQYFLDACGNHSLAMLGTRENCAEQPGR